MVTYCIQTKLMMEDFKDKDVEELIKKFSKEEILLDELLSAKTKQENKLENDEENLCTPIISMEEAIKRNQELLKEFELVKARLRSKAIFCPTEIQWDDICHRYQQSPSLPVTTWRCHIPVFV